MDLQKVFLKLPQNWMLYHPVIIIVWWNDFNDQHSSDIFSHSLLTVLLVSQWYFLNLAYIYYVIKFYKINIHVLIKNAKT